MSENGSESFQLQKDLIKAPEGDFVVVSHPHLRRSLTIGPFDIKKGKWKPLTREQVIKEQMREHRRHGKWIKTVSKVKK